MGMSFRVYRRKLHSLACELQKSGYKETSLASLPLVSVLYPAAPLGVKRHSRVDKQGSLVRFLGTESWLCYHLTLDKVLNL